MSVKAVVFDLDDTLYPETDYVKSGFREVGKEIEKRFGVDNAYNKLCEYFSADKDDVYGRVLRDFGVAFKESDITELVEIYRKHKPELLLSDEVKNTLSALREKGLRLGILTDGRPFQQHAKIESLGLNELVDCIIVTDEFGGVEYRKPNPKAFENMCTQFSIQPSEMVYVGDNPKKDFAIKKYLPVKTVHLMSNGIYKSDLYLDNIKPDFVTDKIENIIKINFNNGL